MGKLIRVDEEVYEKLWDLKYERRLSSLNAVLRELLSLSSPENAHTKDLSDVPVSP